MLPAKRNLAMLFIVLSITILALNIWVRASWETKDNEGAIYIKENGQFIIIKESVKHRNMNLATSAFCLIALTITAILVVIPDKTKK